MHGKRLVFLILLFPLLAWSETTQTVPVPKGMKEIVIKGNTQLTSSEYLDALGIKQSSWFEFWKDDTPYVSTEIIPTVSDTLRDFMDSKGYYDAKINVANGSKKVVVTIREDRPVLVESIAVDSDFNISKTIRFEKGGHFEAAKFIAIKSAIKEELMKAGYCNYQLDTKAYVDLVKRSVVLKYQVKKGALCYFGKTRIVSKPSDISERVIYSRMQYHEGDVFNTEKIKDTFGTLNSLDAFGSGTVSPKEKDDDTPISSIVPIEISLSEKEKLNLFKGGVGYDSALGMRLQLYYERRNFLGDARKVTSTLHYSEKSQFGEMTFLSPAIIKLNGTYFDFYSKLGFSHTIYDAYDENKGYFRVELNYERDAINASLGLGIENINIEKTSRVPSIIEGNFLLLYPYFNLVYDKRDSKINPKNGYYFSAYTEYGLDYEPGASSYLKFLLEGRFIKTFGDLTLATVGKVGVVNEFSGIVPASKLFYAGGAYSNRAYGEKEIGYITSPVAYNALGGKTWMNLSIEGDYPLYDQLYGALFFDSTMINKDAYDFNGETINTVGVGLRYMTPIGPIKLDVGANIEDFDQYGISFQMGQSF